MHHVWRVAVQTQLNVYFKERTAMAKENPEATLQQMRFECPRKYGECWRGYNELFAAEEKKYEAIPCWLEVMPLEGHVAGQEYRKSLRLWLSERPGAALSPWPLAE